MAWEVDKIPTGPGLVKRHGRLDVNTDAPAFEETVAAHAPKAHAASHGVAGSDPVTVAQSQVTSLTSDLALKAPLASPTFTGTPAAPTAVLGTNTTQIATTAFVKGAVDALVASAPGALDTLDELAAALGDDANFAGTVTTNLALKAPLASPTFTGQVAVPLGSAGAPSIIPTGDPNTGIYSPGADQVGIATAGTARVIVDASGITNLLGSMTFQGAAPVINQTTAADRLVVTGGISASTGGAIVLRDDTAATNAFGVEVYAGGSERLRLDTNGLITGTGTSLGAWTSWTPSWTSTGTSPAIGDSTVVAAYMRIGKLVVVRMAITFGATATYGTGAYYFTIPVTAISTAGSLMGGGVAFDSSLSQTYRIFPVYDNTTRLAIHTNASPIGFVGQTAPFTWAQSDVVQLNYWYEAA